MASRVGTVGVVSVEPLDTGTASSVGVADAAVDVAVAIVVGVPDDTADWPVTSNRLLIGCLDEVPVFEPFAPFASLRGPTRGELGPKPLEVDASCVASAVNDDRAVEDGECESELLAKVDDRAETPPAGWLSLTEAGPELAADGTAAFESAVSAEADTAVPVAIAVPIPNATAKAPTRPTSRGTVANLRMAPGAGLVGPDFVPDDVDPRARELTNPVFVHFIAAPRFAARRIPRL
ncbi:hypothetical protein EAH80_11540 [Mycobacterium hodleri]|uniref:Uncharacterized protein n=2 Tax=Mycolicibacterium hodleri TaxID=49897 RepID=A0A502EA22_9MYCO|nr:hypothetical protein EAH80_11540 [Mycolicibacterium hodleri]